MRQNRFIDRSATSLRDVILPRLCPNAEEISREVIRALMNGDLKERGGCRYKIAVEKSDTGKTVSYFFRDYELRMHFNEDSLSEPSRAEVYKEDSGTTPILKGHHAKSVGEDIYSLVSQSVSVALGAMRGVFLTPVEKDEFIPRLQAAIVENSLEFRSYFLAQPDGSETRVLPIDLEKLEDIKIEASYIDDLYRLSLGPVVFVARLDQRSGFISFGQSCREYVIPGIGTIRYNDDARGPSSITGISYHNFPDSDEPIAQKVQRRAEWDPITREGLNFIRLWAALYQENEMGELVDYATKNRGLQMHDEFSELTGPQSVRSGQVNAPWSDEQVKHLNEYQASSAYHPFTGHNSQDQKVNLIATNQGWIAEIGGPIVQEWAHDFMANGGALKNQNEPIWPSKERSKGLEA